MISGLIQWGFIALVMAAFVYHGHIDYPAERNQEDPVSLLSQIITLATKSLSGRSGNRSGYGQQSSGRSQIAQKLGSQAIHQVRKAGPDAAQRQLSKTKFGTDPRAKKVAKAADDLARRFAGTGNPAVGDGRSDADRPVNRYDERR